MPNASSAAASPGPPEGAPAGAEPSVESLLTDLAVRMGNPVTLEVFGCGQPTGRGSDVEVVGADGLAYGRLALAGRPRTSAHTVELRTIAAVIGDRLAQRVIARMAWDRRAVEIRRVLDDGSLSMLYQPILTLTDGAIVGLEGLARFPCEEERTADCWFADAAAVGLGTELEVAAIAQALVALETIPEPLYLSVNVSPSTAASAPLRRALRGRPLDRLMFEITEHAEVTDYTALNSALRPYRRAGLRLAVDDAGAGFASLRHILRMSPDVIKLDRSLARGIDRNPVLRALTYSIAAFASATDAAVIAEGIESEGELDALRFLGIEYGQGYHLARPESLEEIGSRAAGTDASALNPTSAG